MLPSTEAALPLWTATERRCSRKAADLASPVDNLIRWPNSFRNSLDLGPMTSYVSKAIGTKKWLWTRLPNKVSFLSSAKVATAPALLVALAMYEGASVSAGGIPNKEFSILPRHDRDTIGLFPICSVNT